MRYNSNLLLMAKAYIRRAIKQHIEELSGGCCEYCRSPEKFSPSSFAVEHIHPEVKGGETKLENLALSCGGCNSHKYTKTEGRDPQTTLIAPLFHPRLQNSSEHFVWSVDLTEVIGITSTGRATVQVLKLNRSKLINLRVLLREQREHPEMRRGAA